MLLSGMGDNERQRIRSPPLLFRIACRALTSLSLACNKLSALPLAMSKLTRLTVGVGACPLNALGPPQPHRSLQDSRLMVEGAECAPRTVCTVKDKLTPHFSPPRPSRCWTSPTTTLRWCPRLWPT